MPEEETETKDTPTQEEENVDNKQEDVEVEPLTKDTPAEEEEEHSSEELSEEEKEKAAKKAGYLSRNPEEAAKQFKKLEQLEESVKHLYLENARQEAINHYPNLTAEDADLLQGNSPDEIKKFADKLNERFSDRVVETETSEESESLPEKPGTSKPKGSSGLSRDEHAKRASELKEELF